MPTLEEVLLGLRQRNTPPRIPSLLAQMGSAPLPLPMMGPQLPGGGGFPDFLSSLFGGDKSASLAASAAPMPMGLPAPRPMVTAVPGMAPGPGVMDAQAASIAAEIAGKARSPEGIALGDIGTAFTRPTAPPQVSGQVGPGTIKWGLPTPTGADTGKRTFTVGPGSEASPDPKLSAMNLIRSKEGFRDTPYFDVNADRVGYGSDTVTLADGTVKPVTKGMKITKEDAERDLERRTSEFMGTVQTQVGAEAFGKLAPNQAAALTSIAYNYGELPAGVVKAVQSGDPEKVAAAIEGLKGDNKGVNAGRRMDEANIYRGSAMPGAPNYSAPQLPLPGATTPLKGLPLNAFDAFNQLGVTRPPPQNPLDNMANVLAHMATGAAGAKNLGDLLAGAGAGAAAGASENIKARRGEEKEYSGKEDALKRLLAQVSVDKAQAETQGANYQISAKNKDNELLNLVQTEQAKLDTAAKNKVEEHKNVIDWKKWELFQPQIKADKDGVTIIERNPQGGMKVTIQKGNEMDAIADKMGDFEKVYGKGSEAAGALRYAALAKQGEPYVRRQIVRDMVEQNQVLDVLGPDQAKALEKEAEKAVDPKLLGKPEDYNAQKKARMVDLLWGQLQGKDELWLPKMLQKGNFGAKMLAQPGG